MEIEIIRIYLFGSGLCTSNPNDIDLLIVYDAKNVSINEVLALRKELGNEISLKMRIPAHICLLSTNEMEYQVFVKQEKAAKIYPIMPNKSIHQTARSAAALARQVLVGRW